MKKYAYMQKNGIVVTKIANYLLTCQVGDRIKSVREFAKNYEVGHGTVQSAIDYLEATGACQITKNGNKGSYLSAVDHQKLILSSGLNSITGVMGMPHVNWYTGLIKGIEEVFSSRQFKAHITQMPGSINRLNAVFEGHYDFAIIPTDFLTTIGEKINELEVILDIDNEKLVNYNSVVALKGAQFDKDFIPRLGVDFTYQQHLYLSRKYFENKKLTIVPISFDAIINALRTKEIDIAIIEGLLMDENSEFQVIDLISPDVAVTHKREALIVRKSNKAVVNYMKTLMDVNQVLAVQRQFAQGDGFSYLTENNN